MLREVVEVEPLMNMLWINTQRMVADALTKLDSPLFGPLEGFMSSSSTKFPPSTKTKQVPNISAWLSFGENSKVEVNICE